MARVVISTLAIGLSACRTPGFDAASETDTGDGSASSSDDGGDTGGSGGSTEDEGGFLPDSDMAAPPDLGPPDSHAEDMQPIWTSNCVNYCHAAGIDPPAAGLDLYDGAYENIVDRPSTQVPMMMLVAPGDPQASYLWHKLVGTHLDVGGEGEAMPATGYSLDDDTLLRIETWILAGAPP